MLTQRQTEIVHGQHDPIPILHPHVSVLRGTVGPRLTTPAAGRPRPTAVPFRRNLAK